MTIASDSAYKRSRETCLGSVAVPVPVMFDDDEEEEEGIGLRV